MGIWPGVSSGAVTKTERWQWLKYDSRLCLRKKFWSGADMVNRAGISQDSGFEGMRRKMANVFVLLWKLIRFLVTLFDTIILTS